MIYYGFHTKNYVHQNLRKLCTLIIYTIYRYMIFLFQHKTITTCKAMLLLFVSDANIDNRMICATKT